MLENGEVLMHPFILGEVALGNLKQRDVFLRASHRLPRAIEAYNDEVLRFITTNQLFGTGVGYLDAHLLVAAKVTGDTQIWTRDRRLLAVAERLHLAWPEPKPS